MTNKKDILRAYLELSIHSDVVLACMDSAEQIGRDIIAYQLKADKINKKLADMEDANPWIANVLVAMEGT